MDEALIGQVRRLYEVEGLSVRQISEKLGVERKRLFRIIRGEAFRSRPRETILKTL